MNDDRSSIDKANDTLNSRTQYTPPSDKRAVIHDEILPDAPEKWDSPELETILEEHKPDEKPSKARAFFIVSIVVFLAAAGVAAYVFYGGSNFISTKNVDVVVTGPAVIEAGAPLSLTVSIENQNNAPIESAVISIQYPDGTRGADDETQALPRDEAKIGEIKAGADSTQTFRSALFGEKGTVETLKLSLEYKVSDSNATFYKDKTFDVTIGDTPLAIAVEHPSSLVSGEPFTTRIVVASNSADVIKNLVIRAEYPYGYALTSADPAASADNNVWNVGDLAPGDKKTITLHGAITGVNDEERTFRYYAGVADPGNPNSLKNALVSTTDTVQIARPDVSLDLSLNGNADGDYVAPVGSAVNAQIRYQNNSTDKLGNVKITARITGISLDKTSIAPSTGGFYDSNTGLVTWQSPGVPDLSNVAPGASGNVSVSFASLPNLQPGKSQSIDVEADITGQPGGVASAEALTNSDSQTVKIASTVNFSGKALYSRGPYKNIGPLPPKAEATTTYTVVLDLGNTQNDVSDGVVTARLGANVTLLQGGSGADAVTYDQTTGVLTWNVGSLASGAGFSKPLREAVFQVSLKPSIGQIGTVPSLVSGASFSGTDAFTNLPVTATIQNITTRLSTDAVFVQGDDTVMK